MYKLVMKNEITNESWVLNKSKNVSYLNRKMKAWFDALSVQNKDKAKSYFVNDYAKIDGVCTWSIVEIDQFGTEVDSIVGVV